MCQCYSCPHNLLEIVEIIENNMSICLHYYPCSSFEITCLHDCPYVLYVFRCLIIALLDLHWKSLFCVFYHCFLEFALDITFPFFLNRFDRFALTITSFCFLFIPGLSNMEIKGFASIKKKLCGD